MESSEHSSDNCDVDSDDQADKTGRKDTNQSVKPARNKMLDTHRCIGRKSQSAEKGGPLSQAFLAAQRVESQIQSGKFSRSNVFDYSHTSQVESSVPMPPPQDLSTVTTVPELLFALLETFFSNPIEMNTILLKIVRRPVF